MPYSLETSLLVLFGLVPFALATLGVAVVFFDHLATRTRSFDQHLAGHPIAVGLWRGLRFVGLAYVVGELYGKII